MHAEQSRSGTPFLVLSGCSRAALGLLSKPSQGAAEQLGTPFLAQSGRSMFALGALVVLGAPAVVHAHVECFELHIGRVQDVAGPSPCILSGAVQHALASLSLRVEGRQALCLARARRGFERPASFPEPQLRWCFF